MGRRAADPTTPVPLLGVPASVGARGWKSTGGDRSGGALLQTWGQCSIGVQTSPGIIRQPAQLSDAPSNNVTQTSTGCGPKKTEDIFLLTNNNDKKAILRQKSGETKIKKEVTFKALGGDASKDGGTYCYAKAIRTNPLIAGSVTSSRTKVKCAARYINGSVVDSEAIGGISVVNDEVEPAMAVVNCRDRDLHHLNADPSGKMLPFSVIQPLAVQQKTCDSGRQSVTWRGAILGENISNPDTYLRHKPLTSLFTTQPQVPHANANLQQKPPIPQSNSGKQTQITLNPKILYLKEELRYRKIPHPACPVHSRGNTMTSVQPASVLHAKSTTVTKAQIEHFTETQDREVPLITGLTLTPQSTPVKTNSSNSHTYPKLLKTTDLTSAPNQNLCVSVHMTTDSTLSPPSHLSAVAMRSGRTPLTDTLKTRTPFGPEAKPSDSNLNTERDTLHSTNKTQVRKATSSANSSQVAPEYLTLSPSTNPILKFDPQPRLTPAGPPPDPPEPLVHCQPSLGKMALLDTVVSTAQFPVFPNPPHITAPHSRLSTLNHKANPDQITGTSIKHESGAPPSRSTRPNTSDSEPTFHISASSLHKASKPPDSKAELPSARTSTPTSPAALHADVTCKSAKFSLKRTAGSLLSQLTDTHSAVSASSTTNALCRNGVPGTSKAHHTQAANMRRRESNEPKAWGVVTNQESNSRTAQLPSPAPQNVSEDRYKRDAKSTTNSDVEMQSDQNKFRDNLINEFDSTEHENSSGSRVTDTQNYVSLITSSSSSLQGCLNTEQRLPPYQGYAGTKCEGRCATSPPVKTELHGDSDTQPLPLGATASHANRELHFSADRQTHPSHSSPSASTQANCEPFVSRTNKQVSVFDDSPACQNPNFVITLRKQAQTSLEHSVTAPALLNGEGKLCADAGPECDSVLPLSTMLLASCPFVQSGEVDATGKPESTFSPCLPLSHPEDTCLAHSHPAGAAPVPPPSPQCCRSAALERRLRTVEASLAANKDRISTLLNVIHELETVSTPSSRRRCCETGLELKNCSTCQKTACIVYSVEYDFRQQEKKFLEVLNHSGGGNNAFSVHLTHPLDFGLLRSVMLKNLTKTKLKGKKLCKTFLKWLPRKIQQL